AIHQFHELLGGDRLAQVVVGTAFQGGGPVNFLGAGGEYQDRQIYDVAVGATFAGQIVPTHVGHHAVEHKQVWRIGCILGQPIQRIVDQGDVVAASFQHEANHAQQLFIIVNYKDSGHSAVSLLTLLSLFFIGVQTKNADSIFVNQH